MKLIFYIESYKSKGLGSGRDKISPVKIAKFQLQKNHRFVVIFNMSELRSFRNFFNFDAVSVLKHVV